MVRRLNFAIAIRAPVLPAETAASASPLFTASIASHIEDFQRPWRSAWLGLASIRTTTSLCTSREAAFSRGRSSTSGRDHGLIAEQDEFRVGVAGKRNIGAGNHDRRPDVAPHGIERNSDLLGHVRPGKPSCAKLCIGADPVRKPVPTLRDMRARRAATIAVWPPDTKGLTSRSYSLTVPFLLHAASAANGCPAGSADAGASNAASGLRG